MASHRIFATLLTACLLAAPPPDPWSWWSSGEKKNVGVICRAEGSVLGSTLLSNQRSMLGTETQIFSGVSEVPAWRGRLDTVHGRSYFSPSIYLNACNRSKQNCSALPGESYPYEKYEIDPTGSGRPVMRVSFPAGHWSPGSQKPGGTLFYAYPYKTSPTSTANPFSRQTAYFEYEVYFPPDFEFVKGKVRVAHSFRLPRTELLWNETNPHACAGGGCPVGVLLWGERSSKEVLAIKSM